jgi:hypothetical protein
MDLAVYLLQRSDKVRRRIPSTGKGDIALATRIRCSWLGHAYVPGEAAVSEGRERGALNRVRGNIAGQQLERGKRKNGFHFDKEKE